MYCPICSTQAIEGAKFCKSCGMNLNVVTQALNGGVAVSDPLRDREFKRARKQITDGIHGTAIGAALFLAAALPYVLTRLVGMPMNTYIYTLSLFLALAGITKLFRSIGSIIDAKVGQKFLDPTLQPRHASGGLNPVHSPPPSTTAKPSRPLPADPGKAGVAPPVSTRPFALEGNGQTPAVATPPADDPLARPVTGRINREHSSPLRRFEKEDDLLSRLRN
jgi:hypothetical protein